VSNYVSDFEAKLQGVIAMKILIAYDGSDSANTAIDGLQPSGLPAAEVEAMVVSVGEVWLSQ